MFNNKIVKSKFNEVYFNLLKLQLRGLILAPTFKQHIAELLRATIAVSHEER